MKLFHLCPGLAIEYARNGGQALHTWVPEVDLAGAPRCFRRSALIGHLFDQDRRRLEATATALGVRRVEIHRPDKALQHVDLCGRPLERAMELARSEDL